MSGMDAILNCLPMACKRNKSIHGGDRLEQGAVGEKKWKGDAGGRKYKSGEVERVVLSASIVLFYFSFSHRECEVKLLEFLPKDRNFVGIPYRYSDVVL